MKLRQLLADKSAEESVSSSDDIFLDQPVKPPFVNIKVALDEDQEHLIISHESGSVTQRLSDLANLQATLESNPCLNITALKLKSSVSLVSGLICEF